jgi:hypothetical protein
MASSGSIIGIVVFVCALSAHAINSNLKYFSVWDLELGNITDISSWSNFLFTARNATIIREYHAARSASGLLNIDYLLFSETGLHPNIEDNWRSVLQETIAPMLQDGSLFGVFLGDEICWRCISYENLSFAVNLVRESLPRGSAIIYYNEAFPIFTGDVCSSGTPVGYARVPSGLDWISIDYYPDEGTLEVGTRCLHLTIPGSNQAVQRRALPQNGSQSRRTFCTPSLWCTARVYSAALLQQQYS